ncbi:alr1868 [Nostoc sp. PCC 7120 = FACHB-418]|nr:alr1868 [Nostoc sp. PCC 7120 = FACHB-418]
MQAIYPISRDACTEDGRMRVWLACFVVLFALAELFDWVKGFALPLPIYILGGAFLAVASNYDKIIGYYFTDVTINASLEEPQLNLPSPVPNLVEEDEGV